MFDVSTSWTNGAGQVAVYALVISLALWVMSKIELSDRGEAPNEREGE